ncbi:disease resistance protein RGA5-like [Aegilops tauschii subsp. strangulata]|uniref:disease resistance protein RGA5-like n=1 Tax=Aegilops tauschii subsp. strangulata TaxID=200361 RepID=UPI003CC8484C
MERVLLSAVTGALKPVLEKMATLLGDEYKRFKGVRKEIKSLTNELTAMDAFLAKMAGDQDPDLQDKVWMNEVRELSYDMEDAIDDFMLVDDKDTKPDCFIEKIKSWLGKMKAQRRIAKEIQDLKKHIIEVGERNARYKTPKAFSKTREPFSNTSNSVLHSRALTIFEHASKLVGIDTPKAEIIKLLTKENGCISSQKVKIVSIIGSGGMGKTTLANQVYQELKEKFRCKAFVSVSRNPDMTNILRTILSEVSCQDYSHTEAGSIQQLIHKINNHIEEKRYFIVIDDIWDIETWDVIKTNDIWNKVKDSIGRVLKRDPSVDRMIQILSLSYFDLPPHLKGCLLYLSVFPEDSIIEKKGLIRRWIAEGFVCKEGMYTAYELGEMPTSLILSHARSLSVFGQIVKIPSLVEFKHLRVVDFGGCSQLENHHLDNVGNLFQLRYLNISMTKISELPEQIRHLRCLEILNIRHTEVYDLPVGIVDLGKLAHLLVNPGIKFLDGIAKMRALESLKMVYADKQSRNFLQELGQLKNMRKLHLSHMDFAHEHNEIVASSLVKLCAHNLCSLTACNIDHKILLNRWCTSPPLNLQKLVIADCILPKVPDWVRPLVNLQKLRLEVESISPEDLCILGALPALVTLSFLRGREGQFSFEDTMLAVGSETGFRCLKTFTYVAQGDKMDLMFTAGCMSKLENLEIIFHGAFEDDESLCSPDDFRFGVENLSNLVTFRCVLRCSHIKVNTVDIVKASLERAVRTHPNNHLTLIYNHRFPGGSSW